MRFAETQPVHSALVAAHDLSEYDIAYLFVDGIAERIRPGQRREPVLAAWGFTATAPRSCCT